MDARSAVLVPPFPNVGRSSFHHLAGTSAAAPSPRPTTPDRRGIHGTAKCRWNRSHRPDRQHLRTPRPSPVSPPIAEHPAVWPARTARHFRRLASDLGRPAAPQNHRGGLISPPAFAHASAGSSRSLRSKSARRSGPSLRFGPSGSRCPLKTVPWSAHRPEMASGDLSRRRTMPAIGYVQRQSDGSFSRRCPRTPCRNCHPVRCDELRCSAPVKTLDNMRCAPRLVLASKVTSHF